MPSPSANIELPDYIQKVVINRSARAYEAHYRLVRSRTDRLFALLMPLQLALVVYVAFLNHPAIFQDIENLSLKHNVRDVLLLSGITALSPFYMACKRSGARRNQYLIGLAQALNSILSVYLLGGKNEALLCFFALTTFLALYRNWRVLVLQAVFAYFVCWFGAIYSPEVFREIADNTKLPSAECIGWMFFQLAGLVMACVYAEYDMRRQAHQLAKLSVTKELVDIEVKRQMSKMSAGEQRLYLSEVRLHKIIETANDAFVVTGTSGKIIVWSSKAEVLFGWTAEQVLGKDIRVVLGIMALSNLMTESAVNTMIQKQNGKRIEIKAFHRNRTLIPLEASISAMDFNGETTLNIFLHDISARNTMQTQLLHAQKMQGIGELAAGIAHEINTPTQYVGDNVRFLKDSFQELGGFLSCLEIIRDQQTVSARSQKELLTLSESTDLSYLRAEIPAAIEQASDGIRRIGEITLAMKEFSHPGTRLKEEADLPHLIENSVTVCRNEWKYVAELLTEFDPELTTIQCLPNELSQVFVILIVNAAQAIAETRDRSADHLGKIAIRTKQCGSWAEIFVADNGPGIPAANLQRIFEPFFTTKEVGKGTGQGLAIAHSVVVEKHGGSLSVSSQFGEGTTFIVRLPIDGIVQDVDRSAVLSL